MGNPPVITSTNPKPATNRMPQPTIRARRRSCALWECARAGTERATGLLLSVNGVPPTRLFFASAVHRRCVCRGTRSPVCPRSPILVHSSLSDRLSLLVGSCFRTATPILARSPSSAQSSVITVHSRGSILTFRIPAVAKQAVNITGLHATQLEVRAGTNRSMRQFELRTSFFSNHTWKEPLGVASVRSSRKRGTPVFGRSRPLSAVTILGRLSWQMFAWM
jgi:hypothetical protein